jgi:hypothetical protein
MLNMLTHVLKFSSFDSDTRALMINGDGEMVMGKGHITFTCSDR